MTPNDLIEYYKTGYNFAVQTKMSHNTFSNWVKAGYIPFASQKKIEQLTGGELKAEWSELESTHSIRSKL